MSWIATSSSLYRFPLIVFVFQISQIDHLSYKSGGFILKRRSFFPSPFFSASSFSQRNSSKFAWLFTMTKSPSGEIFALLSSSLYRPANVTSFAHCPHSGSGKWWVLRGMSLGKGPGPFLSKIQQFLSNVLSVETNFDWAIFPRRMHTICMLYIIVFI